MAATTAPMVRAPGLDAKYFRRCLMLLPTPYTDLDAMRMTVAYFGLSGLDLIGALDLEVSQKDKQDWINWIYAQQVLPMGPLDSTSPPIYGFRGGPWLGLSQFADMASFQAGTTSSSLNDSLKYDSAHVAMTYTALASLLILGDDLSRVHKDAITDSLRKLQTENGCFISSPHSGESDMRFLYAACAVSYMINDWSGINKDKAVEFILASQGYDYGFAQGPGLETHGGSTYCALASLALMDRLEAINPTKSQTINWLVNRQDDGFAGRPNKQTDTCYSFWVGASLKILDAIDLANIDQQRCFLQTTQSDRGGFSKHADGYPDILHSYFGFAGLTLTGEPGLAPLFAPLNISERAHTHLKTNTRHW